MIKMSVENYCMVNQSGACENIVLWDGNRESWTPPDGYLMLPQATTPAKNWVLNTDTSTWALAVTGFGQIGFLWDGVYLVDASPSPQPEIVNQPTVQGAQTL